MKRTILAAALLLTTPAVAQKLPFEGLWTSDLSADCESTENDGLHAIGSVAFPGRPLPKSWMIQGWDDSCDVKRMQQSGNSTWILWLSCRGEDNTWDQTTSYTLNGTDQLIERTTKREKGRSKVIGLTTYYRCPRFEDYPVTDIYRGPIATPKQDTPFGRKYRTMIREGVENAKRDLKRVQWIAGRYIKIDWGCGMNCTQGALINASTGAVIEVPEISSFVPDGKTYEYQNEKPTETTSNSRLIKLFGSLAGEHDSGPIGFHYYVVDDGFLRYLRSTIVKLRDKPLEPTQKSPKISNKFNPNAQVDTNVNRFILDIPLPKVRPLEPRGREAPPDTVR